MESTRNIYVQSHSSLSMPLSASSSHKQPRLWPSRTVWPGSKLNLRNLSNFNFQLDGNWGNSYLYVFGASNTNTMVLPMLNWPTSSPLLRTMPLRSRTSSKSFSLFVPTFSPRHLFVFSSSSTYTWTEPTFVAPENGNENRISDIFACWRRLLSLIELKFFFFRQLSRFQAGLVDATMESDGETAKACEATLRVTVKHGLSPTGCRNELWPCFRFRFARKRTQFSTKQKRSWSRTSWIVAGIKWTSERHRFDKKLIN